MKNALLSLALLVATVQSAWADYLLIMKGRVDSVKLGSGAPPCPSCANGIEFEAVGHMPHMHVRPLSRLGVESYTAEFFDADRDGRRYGPNTFSLRIGTTTWVNRTESQKPLNIEIGVFNVAYAAAAGGESLRFDVSNLSLFDDTGRPAWRCTIRFAAPPVSQKSGVPTTWPSRSLWTREESSCLSAGPTFVYSDPHQLSLVIESISLRTSTPELPSDPRELAEYVNEHCTPQYQTEQAQRRAETEPSVLFVGSDGVCPGGPLLVAADVAK